ncbi:MAG: hypothetical protein GX123_01175 [Clostridiales bacterium]|nr:hypothetical protein [Clostridiales bacterium]
MKKGAVISLLLAVVLTLTGCALVVKDPVVDMSRVVIDVNGDTMDKGTFMQQYNAVVNYQAQLAAMYANYGMQAPEVDEAQLLQDTIDAAVRQKVLEQKAAELSLHVLSTDEEQQLAQKVEETWKSELDATRSQYFLNTELEGAELEKAVEERTVQDGITRENIELNEKNILVQDKLRAEVIKDVTVTAEEIRAEYDAHVEQDKTAIEGDPNAYGQKRLRGEDVFYAPAGYRLIKQVLIKFAQEDQMLIDTARQEQSAAATALSGAQTAFDANEEALKAEGLSAEKLQELTDEKARLQAELDAAAAESTAAQEKLDDTLKQGYANISEKAQAIYQRAQDGEDFDALAEEFNEDTGTPPEGYAVRKGFTDFDAAFVTPAMTLENPGEVAEPSEGMYGFYIVQYADDVKEGAIDLASVASHLEEELLTEKRTAAYEDTVTQWISDSDVKVYSERIND